MPPAGGACEGCFLRGEGGAGASVPEEDLSAVGAADEEGGVERRKLSGEEVGR